MLEPRSTYEETRASFRWRIPPRYNIAVDVCDRHARDSDRLALVYLDPDGRETRYTFADLRGLSNRLANALRAAGVGRGDRLGILLPQCPETALAHLAAYKLGAVAVPLFTLFGPDALAYRLANSGARGLVTDAANLPKLAEIRAGLPELRFVLAVDGVGEGTEDFWQVLRAGSDRLEVVDTAADDPALIIYTSGTTGPPKGALHAHRTVLGHLPGVEFPHDFFPQPGDLFWTPADWAWIGGLIDVLLPSWHHGVPVLAHRARKFDPEEACRLMGRHGVRNAFLPPTALKMLQQVPSPRERHGVRLRSVGSGGESLGETTLAWGREALGLTINEFYGQTEANLVVGNCGQIMAVKAGSMGRPVPGHEVEVVGADGSPLGPGEMGEVAVAAPDPVMFLGYWNNPEATQRKYRGRWLLTGDQARKDADGYLWFTGRADDLINSAGYRIGPAEIEECLMKHPGVARAAAIGSPDPVRNEVVKAYVVLAPGFTASEALVREIQGYVKERLAAHEYPREVEFLDILPMTTTGKIKRDELRRRDREGKGLV